MISTNYIALAAVRAGASPVQEQQEDVLIQSGKSFLTQAIASVCNLLGRCLKGFLPNWCFSSSLQRTYSTAAVEVGSPRRESFEQSCINVVMSAELGLGALEVNADTRSETSEQSLAALAVPLLANSERDDDLRSEISEGLVDPNATTVDMQDLPDIDLLALLPSQGKLTWLKRHAEEIRLGCPYNEAIFQKISIHNVFKKNEDAPVVEEIWSGTDEEIIHKLQLIYNQLSNPRPVDNSSEFFNRRMKEVFEEVTKVVARKLTQEEIEEMQSS